VSGGYRLGMRLFKMRYALLGWLVARWARKRMERRLNVLAGNRRPRRI
jgi:hypothetical protein